MMSAPTKVPCQFESMPGHEQCIPDHFKERRTPQWLQRLCQSHPHEAGSTNDNGWQ